MNIYEDYVSYMNEVQELIEVMIKNNSSIYYVLSDVIKVTDYIYRFHEENENMDEDLEEIFDIGFGFLANTLEDLKTYYYEYFEKDIDKFNYYSELMLYSVYIEDYKGYLEVNDKLNDDVEKALNELIYQIDSILVNKKPYDKSFVISLDSVIDTIHPYDPDYKTVYNVFRLIVEELGIE